MAVSHLSSSEQDGLLAAAQACATFSLLGSLFIIFCYARYKHLRKLSFTLVLFLAISDVGADITYFMGNPEDNRAACVAQGALQQFFQMAQILWAVAIACVLRDVTVNLRMYHPHEQSALMRRFHVAVWGSALLSTLLPFTTDSYGSTGSWCWIETNPGSDVDVGTMWRYLVLYCPLWAGESVWSRQSPCGERRQKERKDSDEALAGQAGWLMRVGTRGRPVKKRKGGMDQTMQRLSCSSVLCGLQIEAAVSTLLTPS
ncbi:unnamed protein product [Ectocarpus sp. 13 AM-2016]